VKEIKRNFLSLISLLLSLIMLFGCTVQGNAPETGDGKDDKPDADGTVIRIYDARGEGYGVAFSGLSSPITLSDGEIFKNGDLKPVWRELSEIAGVRIAPSESDEADIIIDTLASLTERAEDGELVDLSHLYSSMSMLREYMWANPEVRFAFAADDVGATFVAPTIGLCKRLARLPFVRTDWIELLLNGEGRFEAEECGTLGEIHYEPVMPTDEPLLVPTLSASGLGVKLQKKNYARSGNIIEIDWFQGREVNIG